MVSDSLPCDGDESSKCTGRVSSIVSFSSQVQHLMLLRSRSAARALLQQRPRLLRVVARQQQTARCVQQMSEAPSAPVTAAAATSTVQQENPRPAAFQSLLGITTNEKDIQNTFYQRQLPKSLVRFSSDQGKKLFRSAMEAGHAEGFFSLTGNFTTQSEPAYCGPSSCK